MNIKTKDLLVICFDIHAELRENCTVSGHVHSSIGGQI
jgi:hypothetical protein